MQLAHTVSHPSYIYFSSFEFYAIYVPLRLKTISLYIVLTNEYFLLSLSLLYASIQSTNCSRRYTGSKSEYTRHLDSDISLRPSQATNATPKHGHLSFFFVKCSSFRSLSSSFISCHCLRSPSFVIGKKEKIRLEFRVFVHYICRVLLARQSFRGGDIFFEPGEANNATSIPIFFFASLLVFR